MEAHLQQIMKEVQYTQMKTYTLKNLPLKTIMQMIGEEQYTQEAIFTSTPTAHQAMMFHISLTMKRMTMTVEQSTVKKMQ